MAGPNRIYHWRDGSSLRLGSRTAVMGILNITPDSFSDGGKWEETEEAVRHGMEMQQEGVHLIDIGAESTRPGAVPLLPEEEIQRLIPRLRAVRSHVAVPVSVDTYHAATAEEAIREGAHIINDIWGFQYDDGSMASAVGEAGVPVVLMHNQKEHEYTGDIIDCIRQFLDRSVEIALRHKVKEENIILDPGIGFGKTGDQNMEVIRRLGELTALYPYPFLLGASRKKFIGRILDLPVRERAEGTGAVCLWGILRGCGIVRVHDVKAISRMVKMMDVIMEGSHG